MREETRSALAAGLDSAVIHEISNMSEILPVLKAEATLNESRLKKFFDENPDIAEFLKLLDQKPYLPKDEYSAKEEDFLQKFPDFREKKKQVSAMEAMRAAMEEGSLIAVKGGFAIPATQRRAGRSPNGTFPVNTPEIAQVEDFRHTKGSVTESEFDQMFSLAIEYIKGKDIFVTNRYVGQGTLAIPVRFIGEKPVQAAFTINMFRGDEHIQEETTFPSWTVISLPGLLHPDQERFPQGVFKFTNYRERVILIGGSGYNGEIKKGMFAIANHVYPMEGHLSFHCSSVYNPEKDDVTLVFGLSGTGKSTVASGLDESHLLSDDETGIDLEHRKTFNLENGNYYKTGGLLSEPKVLSALNNVEGGKIAIYENVVVSPEGSVVFAADPTANGRVSIELSSLPGAIAQGMYPMPSRIIILSRDVNAVLDPINILNREQIIFYLNLGYTSKTPGTEAGITKPIPTYSKWEGGPFYDLKDEIIMEILLKFLGENEVEGILLNSGEGGGPFGTKENSRFPVAITLELARAFMDGRLDTHLREHPEDFEENELLRTKRPVSIPEIAEEILSSLNARKNWEKNGHGDQYDAVAKELFAEFNAHARESLAKTNNTAVTDVLKAGPAVE